MLAVHIVFFYYYYFPPKQYIYVFFNDYFMLNQKQVFVFYRFLDKKNVFVSQLFENVLLQPSFMLPQFASCFSLGV